MKTLKVISIQSPNADLTCQQISRYLGHELGIKTEFIEGVSWRKKEAMLDAQEAQLGWICGLPYIHKAARKPRPIELVAAPVMLDDRYQGKPIYFSDVIVHRESDLFSFADLRGRTWAYNEPNSQSGCNITKYHLSTLGEERGYFGRVIQARSHLNALKLVKKKRIDACAIDSTVMELEHASQPDLLDDLRIIDTLGPSPIPPWVVVMNLPQDLRDDIRGVFWGMHQTKSGKQILRQGQIMKMSPIQDHDYDPIRKMEQAAQNVLW